MDARGRARYLEAMNLLSRNSIARRLLPLVFIPASLFAVCGCAAEQQTKPNDEMRVRRSDNAPDEQDFNDRFMKGLFDFFGWLGS